jgi:hypothetical protein
MTQRIPLVNGRGFALVDDADLPLVGSYRWCRLALRPLMPRMCASA